MALRTASSFWRRARASSRLATFAHVISRIVPTAASSTQECRPRVERQVLLKTGDQGLRLPGVALRSRLDRERVVDAAHRPASRVNRAST
jgi:hypothetical protein